ncbi:MAG: hypothetical protein WCH35_09335 [Comamonadaceae bacterium]
MEQSYLDMEARIRFARQQRSVALGNLISDIGRKCKQFFAAMQYPRSAQHDAAARSSAIIGYPYLP